VQNTDCSKHIIVIIAKVCLKSPPINAKHMTTIIPHLASLHLVIVDVQFVEVRIFEVPLINAFSVPYMDNSFAYVAPILCPNAQKLIESCAAVTWRDVELARSLHGVRWEGIMVNVIWDQTQEPQLAFYTAPTGST